MDNTMESLMSSIDALVVEKHKALLREKYRANYARWRLANPDKYKEQHKINSRKYYLANKEKCNQQRMVHYHKKKERDRQQETKN